MSTVIRPVGPHEPRVYWVRRGIIIAMVLILIIVLAEACSGGGGSKHPAAGPGISPSPTASSSTTAITACTPSTVSLVLSTDSDTYTAGQEPQLIGTFATTGAAACKLTEMPMNETWTVMSGTAKIWTNQGCPTSAIAKTVKLKPGHSKAVSITWDGHQQTSGCTAGAVAANGTYTLHATLDGVTGKASVFHFQAVA